MTSTLEVDLMTEYPPMIEVCAVSATKGKVVHSYAIDKPRAEEVATTLFNNIKLLKSADMIKSVVCVRGYIEGTDEVIFQYGSI